LVGKDAMVETLEDEESKKQNKSILMLRVGFGLLLIASFLLWAKAYAAGSMGAPPALLAFGNDPFEDPNDFYIRLMAVDSVRKRKLTIERVHVLNEKNQRLASFDSENGVIPKDKLQASQRLSVAVSMAGEEEDLLLPLLIDRQQTSRHRSAFDGFQWREIDSDYASEPPKAAKRFYPLWGVVSSSLSNPGLYFGDQVIEAVTIAAHPAEVFDPEGKKFVLNRSGYGVTGPAQVRPGEKVTFQLRAADTKMYYVHGWLNENCLKMEKVELSSEMTSWSVKVPSQANAEDALWVSVTASPWIKAQGNAHVARVVHPSSKTTLNEHMAWIDAITNHSFLDDPLRQWAASQTGHPMRAKILKALNSRIAPPFHQAPLVAALPKKQTAAFEAVKAVALEKWRKPYRASALLLSLFILLWLRLEIRSHLLWKQEMRLLVDDEEEIALPRGWRDRFPWHYLWAGLAFLCISALIWGADWVLGLTMVDYRF